jgi:hypothetical protein
MTPGYLAASLMFGKTFLETPDLGDDSRHILPRSRYEIHVIGTALLVGGTLVLGPLVVGDV